MMKYKANAIPLIVVLGLVFLCGLITYPPRSLPYPANIEMAIFDFFIFLVLCVPVASKAFFTYVCIVEDAGKTKIIFANGWFDKVEFVPEAIEKIVSAKTVIPSINIYFRDGRGQKTLRNMAIHIWGAQLKSILMKFKALNTQIELDDYTRQLAEKA